MFRYKRTAHKPHHSTETAVLKVLADILLALDWQPRDADLAWPLGRLRQCWS